MKNLFHSILFRVVITLLIIGIIIILVWASTSRRSTSLPDTSDQTMCTLDARQCPDGSYVGRTGKNCEFICSPQDSAIISPTAKAQVEVKLGVAVSPFGESVKPIELIEDSRCPEDVTCIQAGTVRVRVELASAMGTSTHVFALGEAVTTESQTITLIEVFPKKNTTKELSDDDYTFIFKVEKR